MLQSLVSWLHGGDEEQARDGRPAVARWQSDPRCLEAAVDLYVDYVEVDDSAAAPIDRGASPRHRRGADRRRFVVAAAVPVYGPAADGADGAPGRAEGDSAKAGEPVAYAAAFRRLADAVDEAVEGAVVNEGRTTQASRRTDSVAATSPSRVRRLCEKACAVGRQDPEALVRLLRLDAARAFRDAEPSPLALAYAAAFRVARDARAWLGFAPAKRSYAVSLSASGVNSLAQKYEQLLRDGFEDAEAALQALDALRTRLPVPQRVVRFVRGSEFEDVEEEEDAAQNRRTSFPRARTFSSGGADDDESLKFAPEAADDFLTDAAPLGQGMDDSALFACRDGEKLFFTSSCRVAEQCAYAGRGAPDADASRPAIVARTILYQKLDGARDIALEQGDEIWAATIDGRDYFNVVMADDTDRGLRHVLEAGGVTDLAAIGVDFERVE